MSIEQQDDSGSLLGELFAAFTASEGLLARVDTKVRREMSVLGEGFATNRALVASLASIRGR